MNWSTYFRTYKLHWLLLAVLVWLLSWGYYEKANQVVEIQQLATQTEEALHSELKSARSLIGDEELIRQIANEQVSEQELSHLNQQPYVYGVFRKDSLVWWSDYDVNIPSLARFVQPGEPLMRLENGYYKVFSEDYALNGNQHYAVVLIPVNYEYDIENKYLSNRLAVCQLPGDVQFSITPPDDAPASASVKGLTGEVLFYLSGSAAIADKANPTISLWAFFLGLVLFLTFIYVSSKRLGEYYGHWWGWLLFLIIVFGTRVITLFGIYPEFLSGHELFSPQYYASSDWAPSLGDLFINVVLITWSCWYFYRNISLPAFNRSSAGKWLTSVAYIFLIFAISYYILEITDSLVIDSNLSFDINNFLSIEIYSWLGVVLISLLFASYYLIGYRLLSALAENCHSWKERGMFVLGGFLAWIVIFSFEALPKDLLISGAVGGLFLLLAFFDLHQRWKISRFYKVVLWLAFAALVTSYYLNSFNQIKEQENEVLYANLLLQKDYLTEFLFSQVKNEMVEDPFVRNYFKEDYITKKQLEDQVNFVYLKGHLSKYDIQITPFEHEDDQALPAGLKQYYSLIDSSGQPTEVDGLYFFSQSPEKLEYLAIVRVYEDPMEPRQEQLLGRLVIELQTKSIGYSTIYPELLLKDNATPPDLYNKYDYAIYVKNKLAKRKGNFPYPITMTDSLASGVHKRSLEGYEHLIYKDQPGKIVWVSQPKESKLSPYSLFSIVLLINILGFIGVMGIVKFGRDPRELLESLKMKNASFATRIQVSVIGIILISFLIIGAVVIGNIVNEYNDYHKERLIRKSKQILSNLEYLKNESGDTSSTWEQLLRSDQLKADLSNLSEVHTMDFNLYNNTGRLIESSQPGVFERGLIADYMHPLAKLEMFGNRKSQYIQQEYIGSLGFLASYVPVMDRENNLEAVLNLPYYAKEKNLKEEISNFLVYFINIYVLLLALAAGLGLVISNSLTRPISQLGERMRKIQLGARNTPIRWKKKDEIGRLITEYNNMLEQLEESARLLAQTERESAWREMARQVAHEIKNPLTPMRLSIQHLQRSAMEMESEESDRIKKVCNTLLEQIDQLNHIASEFSNFAKMPRAENEVLDLREILESVVHLYENEELELEWEKPDIPMQVYADENQLNRVFQNLMKNAVESIPPEANGKVSVKLERTEFGGKQFAEVTIADNGIGMDEEQQRRLFEPNFTTKTTGTGLGLPISKKIIELAGGTIQFETKVGEGTTFKISLPIHQ